MQIYVCLDYLGPNETMVCSAVVAVVSDIRQSYPFLFQNLVNKIELSISTC